MRLRKSPASVISNDLGQLLDDLHELLSSRQKDADSALTQLGDKLGSTLDKVRSTSSQAVDQSRALAQNADDYVHDSPWRAIGGALAVGALLGFMLSRR
ncbi:DUF883 family protein [Comamonas sp. w2-DMI]|uniref:YqjD family protein n=1 Tax=Comamonas terrae TaxID=673548 RepID=A0ABW5USN0_9BURK|nr:DUF883 family protein [Comamonas terrae]